MKINWTILLIALAAALLPTGSKAGVRLQCENWAYDEHGESSRVTIFIDNNRMRVDDSDGKSSAIWTFDGDNSTMIAIEHDKLEYVRFTKDTTKKLFQKIEGAVEQLETFLPQMEKEQRDHFKAQATPLYRMYHVMSAAKEEDKKFKYEKGAEAETIMEIECSQLKGFYKNDHFHDAWVAPFNKLGVSQADVAPLLNVPEAFRGLFSMNVPITSLRGDAGGGALGMPMRVVMYDGDTKAMRCDVLEIHSEDVDASRFEIDDVYDEVEFDEWLSALGQR